MTAVWTIKDGDGQLHPELAAATPMEVGRRIVPGHYDAFRLHVSSSYREVFHRAVAKVLAEHGWQIVRMPSRARRMLRHELPLAA